MLKDRLHLLRRATVLIAATGVLAEGGQAQADGKPVSPNHLIGLALAAGTAVLLVAPPILGAVIRDSLVDTDTLHARRSGVRLNLSLGVFGPVEEGKGSDAGMTAVGFEAMYRGHLLDIRSSQQFATGGHQVQSLQVGHLFRMQPSFHAGFTVGPVKEGALYAVGVGLPAVKYLPGGWMKIEPLYVFSREAVSWHWRLEFGFPVEPRAPLVLGFALEAKPIRPDGPYYCGLSVLVGLRP